MKWRHHLSWIDTGSWIIIALTLFAAILLLLVIVGCGSVEHKPSPTARHLPAASEQIVKTSTTITGLTESSTVAAKGIARAAEAGAEGMEVDWTADFVDPAQRIVADQDAIHAEVGTLLGPVLTDLKAAKADQEKLGKTLILVTEERDQAIKDKAEGVQRILTWASAACFIGAIIAIGLCFVPLIDKRLAIVVAASLFGAGSVLGLIVKFYFWFMVGGAILFVLAGLAVLWMWRKGLLTDGRLAGAMKLFEEGKPTEGIAVLRSALPDFDLAWRNRKR